MIIFISGSVNAGKSTTAELVAEKLNGKWLDSDVVNEAIPDFDLDKDIEKGLELLVGKIRTDHSSQKAVVVSIVLRQEDRLFLKDNLKDLPQYYFTLAPSFDVARSDRGRGMNDWEFDRIKYHYGTGIADPEFGIIIDSSNMNLEQVAEEIIRGTDFVAW